jgi:Phosphoribosyl-AMP cyclohydrolase
MNEHWLTEIKWTEDGLVPVLIQDVVSGKLLMFAWMNREALELTVRTGRAVYWSRSRKKLWRKGETSGHEQVVRELRLDCDGDAVQLLVEQQGGIACHTGRNTCFFRRLKGHEWVSVEPVIKAPQEIYGLSPMATLEQERT